MCRCPIITHKIVWLPLCLTPGVVATNTSHLCGCHYASHSRCGCHYASHPCSVVATMPHTETVANLLDTLIPKQRVHTFRQLTAMVSQFIPHTDITSSHNYVEPLTDITTQCLLTTWRVKGAVNEGGTILIPAPGHSTEIVYTSAEHVSQSKDLRSPSPATVPHLICHNVVLHAVVI